MLASKIADLIRSTYSQPVAGDLRAIFAAVREELGLTPKRRQRIAWADPSTVGPGAQVSGIYKPRGGESTTVEGMLVNWHGIEKKAAKGYGYIAVIGVGAPLCRVMMPEE